MGKLDGKVAAITGGTRSIGRGIADAFLREGASVVVNGRDEAKGQACLEEMGAGDRAAFFAGDASKQDAVEGLVDFAIDHYGQLDIMVLNSGGVKQTAPVAQMTDEEWQFEVDWNLNHVFWGMRRALQHMIPRQSGRILVTSSVEGKLGKPGIPGYVACKHAVNGLVKAAAHEVGTLGITVNALLPGIIETDIVRDTGPDSAVAMGVGTLRQHDRHVHRGVGDQAAEHRRGGRRGGRAAGLRRRPQHHRLPVPGRRRDDAVLMARWRHDRRSPAGSTSTRRRATSSSPRASRSSSRRGTTSRAAWPTCSPPTRSSTAGSTSTSSGRRPPTSTPTSSTPTSAPCASCCAATRASAARPRSTTSTATGPVYGPGRRGIGHVLAGRSDRVDYSHAESAHAFEPFDGYAELREHCPLHAEAEHDPPFYVLSRFRDVVDVLKQPTLWGNRDGPGVFYQEAGVLGSTDDPDHARHRRIAALGVPADGHRPAGAAGGGDRRRAVRRHRAAGRGRLRRAVRLPVPGHRHRRAARRPGRGP